MTRITISYSVRCGHEVILDVPDDEISEDELSDEEAMRELLAAHGYRFSEDEEFAMDADAEILS